MAFVQIYCFVQRFIYIREHQQNEPIVGLHIHKTPIVANFPYIYIEMAANILQNIVVGKMFYLYNKTQKTLYNMQDNYIAK